MSGTHCTQQMRFEHPVLSSVFPGKSIPFLFAATQPKQISGGKHIVYYIIWYDELYMQYINISQKSIIIIYRFHCRVWSVFWTNQTKKKRPRRRNSTRVEPPTIGGQWQQSLEIFGELQCEALQQAWADGPENFRIYWDFTGFCGMLMGILLYFEILIGF